MILTTIVLSVALTAQNQGAQPITAAAFKPAAVTITPKRTFSDASVIQIAPAPKGSIFAASTIDSKIRIYDAKYSKMIIELGDHPQPVYALAWSPDGRYMASGDESARIFIWKTEDWSLWRQYRSHQRGIQQLDFNAQSTMLISTGKDDMIKLWDLRSSKKGPARDYPGMGAMYMGARWIGATEKFGVGILSYGAREYSGATGSLLGFFPTKQSVQDVDYRPDGKLMAAGGRDGNISVWNPAKRVRLATMKGHEGWIWHLRFSPNGKLLASSADDRTIRIWDAVTYQPVMTIPNQASFGSPLSWTADGKYLLTVNVGEVLQTHTVSPEQSAPPVKPLKPVKKKAKPRKKR
ncbi:MAG: WD40 repeat domain-containing protein [Fimbriimonadaceae bacterium]